MKIEKIIDYTIPMFGNRRIFPYGKLLVSDGEIRKVCPIKDDGSKQYITFKRRRHYIRREGSLYSPRYEFVEE